jgi:hypothetical protein
MKRPEADSLRAAKANETTALTSKAGAAMTGALSSQTRRAQRVAFAACRSHRAALRQQRRRDRARRVHSCSLQLSVRRSARVSGRKEGARASARVPR